MMTRDDAEKLTKHAWPKVSVGNNYGGLNQGSALGGLNSGMTYAPMTPSVFVELAIALGMLKLDEPMSVRDRAIKVLDAAASDPYCGPHHFLTRLDAAGLKIVEK